MMIEEFAEDFTAAGHVFKGIWTDFDERSPAGDAGIITRVARILVSDKDASFLNNRAEIQRLATGIIYLVKTSMRSGIGLTGIDLEMKVDEPYQGEF